MYFEVLLQILVSFFAVFGFVSLVCLIAQAAGHNDRLSVTVAVTRPQDMETIDIDLEDAGTLCFLRDVSHVTVLLGEEMAEKEEVRATLDALGASYYVIKGG